MNKTTKIILCSIASLLFIGIILYLILYSYNNKNCCKCPSVPCESINYVTSQVRNALNVVVPKKWFLVEGTLIAALRWGKHCHVFNDGKKNFVDGDMDVYIITPKNKTKEIINKIGAILSSYGWTHPKNRGDGIYTAKSSLSIPSCSCVGNIAQRRFYLDIHVMHPVENGYDVSTMKHLWKYFLIDNILPSDVIFPLVPCSWGGGVSYAPSKYLNILSKWNGNEYGSADKMWHPLEQYLATGAWFSCRCNLTEDNRNEVKNSIRYLQMNNMASFNIHTL